MIRIKTKPMSLDGLIARDTGNLTNHREHRVFENDKILCYSSRLIFSS